MMDQNTLLSPYNHTNITYSQFITQRSTKCIIINIFLSISNIYIFLLGFPCKEWSYEFLILYLIVLNENNIDSSWEYNVYFSVKFGAA